MEPLDVVIVGAGFGGIGAAIQLKRLGYHNIAVLERETRLGGTWHVNRYPGLAVDAQRDAGSIPLPVDRLRDPLTPIRESRRYPSPNPQLALDRE